jgi:hypothetical protein
MICPIQYISDIIFQSPTNKSKAVGPFTTPSSSGLQKFFYEKVNFNNKLFFKNIVYLTRVIVSWKSVCSPTRATLVIFHPVGTISHILSTWDSQTNTLHVCVACAASGCIKPTKITVFEPG